MFITQKLYNPLHARALELIQSLTHEHLTPHITPMVRESQKYVTTLEIFSLKIKVIKKKNYNK